MDSTTIRRKPWSITRNSRRKQISWNTMCNNRINLPAVVPFYARDSRQQEQEPSEPACLPMVHRPSPKKEEVAESPGETWQFSDFWLRSKSSKPIYGNNTTNWEES